MLPGREETDPQGPSGRLVYWCGGAAVASAVVLLAGVVPGVQGWVQGWYQGWWCTCTGVPLPPTPARSCVLAPVTPPGGAPGVPSWWCPWCP